MSHDYKYEVGQSVEGLDNRWRFGQVVNRWLSPKGPAYLVSWDDEPVTRVWLYDRHIRPATEARPAN